MFLPIYETVNIGGGGRRRGNHFDKITLTVN